ncbi:MAG: hypothetical protein ACJ0O0_06675 [Flavobacteriaceae bacterium]|nr:hypothetical protein [Flavobacteriales bacterium]|tara:strand:- start:2239 stop:2709 length:471 start_codon:yes stop_codon:yes gene_type:complete
MENKINLKIEGDHEFGLFSMFVVEVKRDNISLPIFLTAEQTNLGLEDPDEAFEPIMELLNILLESGFSVHQTIEIVNGDESEQQHEFISNFDNRIDEAWNSEIQQINIRFSNLEDPQNSNIELESIGGHNFIIYTENNEISPVEIMNKLKVIFKQN